VFVLTRRVAGNAPDDAVYRFVGGLGEALTAARDAAAGKDVTVMGGAQTGRQFLAAGLVDEVSIHLVPVLLGGGTRMFEDGETRQLESVDVVATPSATHMRYRVVKSR
jgi:dihydrofolate reductase